MHNPESSALPRITSRQVGAPDDRHSPLELALTALRYWWWVTLPTGAILAAVGIAAVLLTFEPSYRADATLRIKSYQPHIVFSGRMEDVRSFVNTQRELMRSPLVLAPLLSHPDIASLPELTKHEDPLGYLRTSISIRSIQDSELYLVSFTGPDPDNAAKIVNAVVHEFFKFHDDVEMQQADRVIELLQTEHEHHGQRVANLRNEVRELSTLLTGRDPSLLNPSISGDDLARSRLAFLETELAKNAVDQAMQRSQLTALKELASRTSAEATKATADTMVSDDPEVQGLAASIAELRRKRQSIHLHSRLGEKDPVYQRTSKELEQELENLRLTQERVAKRIQEDLVVQHTLDVQQLKARLETAEVMEGALSEQYKEELSQSRQITGDTLELEFKRAELAQVENVHNMIATRIVALQTERRAPARIELLADAEAPTAPVENFPLNQVALAAGAGMCLPIFLAVAYEYRIRRVSSLEQWRTSSSLPVLAEIAEYSLPPNKLRLTGSQQRPRLRQADFSEEAIHGLRTQLMLSESLRHMKVFAVTSAVSGEGKSSVASQLAYSFAKSAGKNVLLVDGDLRAPDQHKIFGVARSPGLADVLQDPDPPAAIRAVSDGKLHLLSAGRPTRDTHVLVTTPEMSKLFDQAREQYDVIIIDTPPVLAAYESLILAKLADAAVLCVMRGTSRLDQVSTAHAKLKSAGVSPVGAVISGVARREYYRSYGNYRYSDN